MAAMPSSSLVPASADEDTCTSRLSHSPFEADLARRLESLQTSSSSCPLADSFFSLDWIMEAMSMLVSTQASLQAMVLSALHDLPLSQKDADALASYMEDCVKLMDACKATREMADEVDEVLRLVLAHSGSLLGPKTVSSQYHTSSESGRTVALERARRSLGKCLQRMARYACSCSTRRHSSPALERLRDGGKIAKQATMKGSNLGTLFTAMEGAHAIAILVLWILSNCLSLQKPGATFSPSSKPPFIQKNITAKLQKLQKVQPLWLAPLLALHSQLKKQLKTPGITREAPMQALYDSVQELFRLQSPHSDQGGEYIIQDHKLMRLIMGEALVKKAQDMQASIGTLSQQAKSLSDMLVSTRMAILTSLANFSTS